MPVPEGPQFNIELPFPRLRKAYAKTWSKGYAQMLQSEGELISPEGLHGAGEWQAESMVEMALQPDGAFARKLLYKNGFQKRHTHDKEV
jgi:hypothetical protein